jgi:CheY-like chemotaxis protein
MRAAERPIMMVAATSHAAYKIAQCMLIFQRFALFSGICLLSVSCWAQADPFGGAGAGGLFPAEPEAAAPAEEDEADDSPLVRQLLEHSRRGHVQMANAIASLARIGRWSDVDRLLAQLSTQNLGAQALAEMSAEIRPALFLRMKTNEALTDPARAALDQIGAAAIAQAESPERLRQAIGGLASDQIDTKLASARALFGGGNVAVSELVAAAVSENPPAPRDDILRAMLKIGSGGLDALRQLALYGTPTVRNRALQSIARIDRGAYIADLVTAAHALDAGEAELATARANLQRLDGGFPGPGSSAEFLMRDFLAKQDDARLMDNDDQPTTLWSVNEERTGVTHQLTPRVFAAYRDIADAGTRLRRLGGMTAENESAVLAADLAYRLMVDPDWGDPEQIDAIRKAYGSAVDASAISSAIHQTLANGDHAATIGLIRMIDVDNATVLDRNLLLDGHGASPSPLVQAASASEPQIRFEAALVAARLAQGAPYPGSSRVMHCLSEMRNLGDRPSAIVVETRPEVIIQLERILGDLGFRVQAVGTVRQLQRSIDRGGDLRLILSKTELADLPAIEMIDLVRRMDRGRQLPIVLYGAETAGLGSNRWEAVTVRMVRPASPAALDGVMDTVKRRRRLPALSGIDRQSYRAAASQLLDGLAKAG